MCGLRCSDEGSGLKKGPDSGDACPAQQGHLETRVFEDCALQSFSTLTCDRMAAKSHGTAMASADYDCIGECQCMFEGNERADHYRALAERLRALAIASRQPEVRAELLWMAQSYERIAEGPELARIADGCRVLEIAQPDRRA